AAGCDLLILKNNIKRSQPAAAPTGKTIVPSNCGKQIQQATKARHKDAANGCFSTVLTCPRLLWSWL
ncbi:hypothetical protein, partial [Pseudomonas sp. 18058]|uniref:hypothetical protein n=1 Tax=Pseudomonas sp. 18058 TaxID=2681406 RepID=UPI001C49A9FC